MCPAQWSPLADAVLALLLLLALGVPLAAPLAVLVFIGALVPLVGAPAAMLLAVLVALITSGPVTALVIGVGIALIGQIEGHLLEPLVMNRTVKLHPVVVALTVTIGALVSGILGAVLAVPVVATAWAVFAQLRKRPPPLSEENPVTTRNRSGCRPGAGGAGGAAGRVPHAVVSQMAGPTDPGGDRLRMADLPAPRGACGQDEWACGQWCL
ncbi:protein of unknown function DUF20 [Promicromonospora umidemergens]|uniref:AI-2E family transporter n=1 Tax=Promicromonospora umidemergens TaxID=629679 RepID=UPI0027E33954|nr:AI-2E family transporter [Promicromonospora umidemergens]MCP2282771.1 protein of unknown function DUF20 [Promicromonospora umidemergens]